MSEVNFQLAVPTTAASLLKVTQATHSPWYPLQNTLEKYSHKPDPNYKTHLDWRVKLLSPLGSSTRVNIWSRTRTNATPFQLDLKFYNQLKPQFQDGGVNVSREIEWCNPWITETHHGPPCLKWKLPRSSEYRYIEQIFLEIM